VYAQEEVMVTPKLVDRVVKEKVDEHKRKLELKNYNEK
jgi:ATPase family AAA domain-containing protein 3A/B